MQHTRLGQHLREAYQAHAHILDEPGAGVYARATNYPRTIQSAVGLLMGLFPGERGISLQVNPDDAAEIMHGVGLAASSKHAEQHPGQGEKTREGRCDRAVAYAKAQLAAFKPDQACDDWT